MRPHSRFPALLVVLLTSLWMLCSPRTAHSQIYGRVDDLAVPAAGISGAVIKDEGFIFGGRDAAGNYLNTALKNEACNTCTTWLPLANMPTPRAFAAAVALPDETIMVIGGENASGPVGNIELYNPATNSWSTMMSLPGGLTRSKAIVVNGILHLIGGYGNPFGQVNDEVTNIHLAYNPTSQQWSALPFMNFPIMDHELVYYRDGTVDEIWVMGGRTQWGASVLISPAIIKWSGATQQWETTPSFMPGPRANFGAASTSPNDGEVFIFGGYSDTSGTIDPSVYRYNPNFSNTWMVWDPNFLPLAEFWFQGYWDYLSNNCVYLFRTAGGVDASGNLSPIAHRRLLVTGPLAVESLAFTATPLEEGVHLQWTVEQSDAISHFRLSHSQDGLDYRSLQDQSPAEGLTQWDFLDGSARSDGQHYYQLEAFDWNGNLIDTRTALVLFSHEGELGINIYPQPAGDELQLIFSEASQDRQAKLISIDGSVVLQKEFQNRTRETWDLGGISAGLYFLEVVSEGKVIRQRVVVQ